MKIFVRILKVLAIIILIISAVGFLFFPGKVHVERTIEISKSPATTFAYVSDFKNWNSWSPWYKKDPNAKYEFENGTNAVGSKVKWESEHKEVGKGAMTITELKPDSLLRMDLTMEGGSAVASYRVTPSANGSTMAWGFDVDCGVNPLLRIMGSLMKGMLEKTFDEGLVDLKKNLEAMPDVATFKLEEVQVPATNYLFVHDSAGMSEIGMHLGKNYQLIGQSAGKQKLKMAGSPFAIYYNGGNEGWAFDAGVPMDKAGKDDGQVKAGQIKPGNAIKVHYYGDYSGSAAAHAQAHEYIGKNNKKIIGAPWEVYVTDPMAEKDTSKWLTEVYYPVE